MDSLQIIVSGRVQGVSFRVNAFNKARELGICGFVKNQSDGSVYIEAEGEPEKMKLFLDWCRTGPEKAAVSSISIIELNPTGFLSFEIRR